jgi:hypothetical protein
MPNSSSDIRESRYGKKRKLIARTMAELRPKKNEL